MHYAFETRAGPGACQIRLIDGRTCATIRNMQTIKAGADPKCPRCGKQFKSHSAVNMHIVRVHSRAGIAGWKKAISVSARRKALRAVQSRKNDSDFGEKISAAMRESWARRKGKRLGMSATAALRLPKDEAAAEQRRKYHRKWYARLSPAQRRAKWRRDSAARRAAQRNGAIVPQKRAYKKPPAMEETPVTFCPRCGCNIRNVIAAIRFGDQQ